MSVALAFVRRYWPQLLQALGVVLLLVAFMWVLFERNAARGERDALAAWQMGIVVKVSAATVPGGKLLRPGDVSGALDGLVSDRDDARRALTAIDKATRDAKARGDAADSALAAAQVANEAKLAIALREINRLRAVKGTGDPVADAKLIEEMSDAAWKGWK